MQAVDDDNTEIDDAGEEMMGGEEDVVVVADEKMNMLTAKTWTTSGNRLRIAQL